MIELLNMVDNCREENAVFTIAILESKCIKLHQLRDYIDKRSVTIEYPIQSHLIPVKGQKEFYPSGTFYKVKI